jgi:hypothetical protein
LEVKNLHSRIASAGVLNNKLYVVNFVKTLVMVINIIALLIGIFCLLQVFWPLCYRSQEYTVYVTSSFNTHSFLLCVSATSPTPRDDWFHILLFLLCFCYVFCSKSWLSNTIGGLDSMRVNQVITQGFKGSKYLQKSRILR